MKKNEFVSGLQIFYHYKNKVNNEIRLGFQFEGNIYLYNNTYNNFECIDIDKNLWKEVWGDKIIIYPTKLSYVHPFSDVKETLIGVFEVSNKNYSFIITNNTLTLISNENIFDVNITNDSSSYLLSVLNKIYTPLIIVLLMISINIITLFYSDIIIFITLFFSFIIILFLTIFSISEISENDKVSELSISTFFSLFLRKDKKYLETHNLPYYVVGSSGIGVIGLKLYSLGSENDIKNNLLILAAKKYYKKVG